MVDQNSNDLKYKNDYEKPDIKQRSIQQEAQGQLSDHLNIKWLDLKRILILQEVFFNYVLKPNKTKE